MREKVKTAALDVVGTRTKERQHEWGVNRR